MKKKHFLPLCLALVLVAGFLSAPVGASEGGPEGKRFIAYYFFGDQRCSSCRTIEKYAEETVTRDFADELASGRLTWKPVNAMKRENLHFIDDFALTNQTVVLAEVEGDKVVRWKRLDRVWQLLRNKIHFQAYVYDEISSFMGS